MNKIYDILKNKQYLYTCHTYDHIIVFLPIYTSIKQLSAGEPGQTRNWCKYGKSTLRSIWKK